MANLKVDTISGIGTEGPVLNGGLHFRSKNYLTLPKGTTAERTATSSGISTVIGAIRYNTDSNKMECYVNNKWMIVSTSSPNLAQSGETAGTRGLWLGGAKWHTPSPYNTAEVSAVSLASNGDAFDFGDMTEARRNGGQCANASRALLAGGFVSSRVNTIDFITISSTGNGTDFGDRTTEGSAVAGAANATRGVWHGGNTPSATNIIDFITIASTGNAVDFGDTTHTNNNNAGFSSPTRGIFGANGPNGDCDFVTIPTTGNAVDFTSTIRLEVPAAGSNATRGIFAGGEKQPSGGAQNGIIFHTIATLGNFVNFGDMTSVRLGAGGASSSTRFVIAGGSNPSNPNGVNVIEYVSFSTRGNAVDFGDLNDRKNAYAGCSNGHGGL